LTQWLKNSLTLKTGRNIIQDGSLERRKSLNEGIGGALFQDQFLDYNDRHNNADKRQHHFDMELNFIFHFFQA
jgi:hypothetical protein